MFGIPIFGLNAVLFHLHRAPAPKRRTRDGNRKPDWDSLHHDVPTLAATMRRYLDQLAISLRPNSVNTIDTTLRMFGRYIADHHPNNDSAAEINRLHIEGFKPWLADRPGHKGKPQPQRPANTGHSATPDCRFCSVTSATPTIAGDLVPIVTGFDQSRQPVPTILTDAGEALGDVLYQNYGQGDWGITADDIRAHLERNHYIRT